jgi:hypothetical protein
MPEPQKITIIEGAPPAFELANEAWLLGLAEGPVPARVAMCRLRSQNAPELVERCYRAWRSHEPISLEYRGEDGLTQQVSIAAVRWVEIEQGQMLLVWVRLLPGQLDELPDLEDPDDIQGEESDEDFDEIP